MNSIYDTFGKLGSLGDFFSEAKGMNEELFRNHPFFSNMKASDDLDRVDQIPDPELERNMRDFWGTNFFNHFKNFDQGNFNQFFERHDAADYDNSQKKTQKNSAQKASDNGMNSGNYFTGSD